MEPVLLAVISFAALLLLLFVGVQVGLALLLLGFVGLVFLSNFHAAITLTTNTFFTQATVYTFTVVPLFVIMGEFITVSGVAPAAFEFAKKWVSRLPGALYLVTVVASALLAAASGSAIAVTVAVGKMVMPEMKALGYNEALSGACVAASGTMGIMIPPSLMLVLYGVVVEESVGRLLLAGFLPGILEAVTYGVGLAIICKLRPQLVGPPPKKGTWKERFAAIPSLWGIILIFTVVIGGLYTGVVTPTEVGALGTFVALIMLIQKTKRRFFKHLRTALFDTMGTTAMLFTIIIGSIVFSKFLVLSGAMAEMSNFIAASGLPPVIILGGFLFLMLIGGMFMSGSGWLMIIGPIAHATLLPLGYDGIWLGIIMVRLMELGSITPPVGLTVFALKGIAPHIPTEKIFLSCSWFMIMDAIDVALLVAFPQISLWLPNLAFGVQ